GGAAWGGPVEPMDGVQPSEFTFAVQYTMSPLPPSARNTKLHAKLKLLALYRLWVPLIGTPVYPPGVRLPVTHATSGTIEVVSIGAGNVFTGASMSTPT